MSSGAVTATIDSLFVRTRCPMRSESRGSAPLSRHPASSLFVPSAPAATTTPRAVTLRDPRRTHAPVRSCVTA